MSQPSDSTGAAASAAIIRTIRRSSAPPKPLDEVCALIATASWRKSFRWLWALRPLKSKPPTPLGPLGPLGKTRWDRCKARWMARWKVRWIQR
jgi:hypothetical protein